MKNNYLLVVAGPTAIGKTALGIQLAEHFKTEIISADSRQFYKEMAIGTARPSGEELARVRHHFVASHSIHEELNVGHFEREALQLLEQLFQLHKVVVMVGGSGLYIKAVCNGLDDLPLRNEKIREMLKEQLQTEGIKKLQQQLNELDPEHYNQIDLSNPQRLIRALEVCLTSGEKFSAMRKGNKQRRPFHIIKIGLNTDRDTLYQHINSRVDRMMQEGLFGEAQALYPLKHLNALQTVGYTELFDHLEGKTSLQKAVELIKQHTRNFAKRQLTWLRKDKEIAWFEPGQLNAILKYAATKMN